MKTILIGLLIVGTISCSQKAEKKEVTVPKTKTIDTESIIEDMFYKSQNGFECEIENLRTNKISNIFYYKKLNTGIDLLEHSFYPINDDLKKVKGKINIDEYQFGNVQYKTNVDELYEGSSIASGSKNFSTATITFDSKVNEFEVKIIKYELINDITEKVETDSVARITNCKADFYKVSVIPNI
jgi:hypothetical protein